MAKRGGTGRSGRAALVSIAVVLALSLALASCGRVGGGTFVAEHPRAGGPLPVELTDSTGRLVSFSPGEQLEGRERFGIVRADGLLPTVEIWWVGRACDERVAMTLEQIRDRFRLEVDVVPANGCGDDPVSRSVLLSFADGVTAEDFDVIVPTAVEGRRQ